MVMGEITSAAEVIYEQVARNAIKEVGYDAENKGLDYKKCTIIVQIDS